MSDAIERVRRAASELMEDPEMQPDLEHAADLMKVCSLAEEYVYLRTLILDQCKRTCEGRQAYAGRLRHDPLCLAEELSER